MIHRGYAILQAYGFDLYEDESDLVFFLLMHCLFQILLVCSARP